MNLAVDATQRCAHGPMLGNIIKTRGGVFKRMKCRSDLDPCDERVIPTDGAKQPLCHCGEPMGLNFKGDKWQHVPCRCFVDTNDASCNYDGRQPRSDGLSHAPEPGGFPPVGQFPIIERVEWNGGQQQLNGAAFRAAAVASAAAAPAPAADTRYETVNVLESELKSVVKTVLFLSERLVDCQQRIEALERRDAAGGGGTAKKRKSP